MPPSASPLAPESRAALDSFIADAATRGERIVCVGRFSLAALSLTRSVTVWIDIGFAPTELAVVAGTGAALFLMVFSAWIFLAYRHRPAPRRLLAFSVTVDSVACFGALLTNPLWPGPGYEGLIYKPDLASLLLVAVTAGLRLSPWVAVWGGFLSLASLFLLVGIDATLSGPPVSTIGTDLSAMLALLVGCSTAGIVAAVRTRRLVLEGALRAVRIEQAERNLGALMQDQHDVRTLLSSASLNADLVLRRLERGDERGELPQLAQQVREDLDRVNEFVVSIRERSYEDLVALQAAAPADAGRVFAAVGQQLRGRFDRTLVEISAEGLTGVSVAGGERALARVALNLLVNACEGNGRQAPSKVEVHVRGGAGEPVGIDVLDDGPGFEPSILDDFAGGYTTKHGGSGLGLAFVGEVVRASGGQWMCRNRREGGASVTISLPAAKVGDG